MGAFLVLVGLAGLAVGGVGVVCGGAGLSRREDATIATLKTLGATGGLIFRSLPDPDRRLTLGLALG